MKMPLAFCLLFSAFALHSQQPDIAALRDKCIPEAPLSTLSAIVHVESGGNPNAMQIDFPNALLKHWHMAEGSLRLARQPANKDEALAWLHYFEAHGIYVDLGLMQVSSYEAKRRSIDSETLLDPCTNLRTGWQILTDAYQIEIRTYGPGQLALEHAISRYNTGDSTRGIDNGYLSRVLTAVKTFPGTTNTKEKSNGRSR